MNAIRGLWMRQRIGDRGLPADLASDLERRLNMKVFKVTEKGASEEKGAGILAALIFLILMYSTFFMYGYQVMRGVIEEKSNRIVEIAVLDEVQDRPERFGPDDRRLMLRADDRRLDEVAGARQHLVAAQHRAAITLRRGDRRLVALHRRLVDQRAHQDAFLHRVADADLRIRAQQALLEFA